MTQIQLDEHGRKIYEPDGIYLGAYLIDRSPVSIIRGPIGSGTSSASMMKMFQISCEQAAGRDGVRKSRWLVVRDSYPALETTTIKTWLNWFPENLYGKMIRTKPYYHRVRVGDVDMEVYFLALDDDDAIGKLRSLELTGAFFNELEFSSKEIFDEAMSRCGRYPPRADADPTWYGIIADLNAPPEDHWLPQLMQEVPPPEDTDIDDMAEYTRPEGWCYLVQPPALLEVKGDDGKSIKEYKVNPEAENLKWLPDGYYEGQVKSKKKSWIDSRLMNRIIPRIDGRRVWPEFTQEVHVAQRALAVIPNHPVFVGFDFGRSPGVVFAQCINDRWFVQYEMGATDIATSAFAPMVKKFLALHYPGFQMRCWGDPKGRDKGQNDDKTAYQVYQNIGITIEAAPVKNNNIQTRIDVVSTVLNEMRDGKPRVLFSPACRVLVMGMAGGYHYRKISGSTRYADEPEKNKYSHRCFVAGTKISTPAGDVAIESLRIGDLVNTPLGPRRVENIGENDADTVALLWQNGIVVRCTPDHPFMTQRGWVAADELQSDDEAVTCNEPDQWKFLLRNQTRNIPFLSSMVCAITSGPKKDITAAIHKKAEPIFTAMSGRSITALFQRIATFIISILIPPIISPTILNANMSPSISPITWQSQGARKPVQNSSRLQLPLLPKSVRPIQNGHQMFRATLALQPPKSLPPFLQLMLSALGATSLTRSRPSSRSVDSAPPRAKEWRVRPVASMMKAVAARFAAALSPRTDTPKRTPVRLLAKKSLCRARVYNITVSEAHCYYAEGLLVSNCDALQYLFLGAGEGRSMAFGNSTGQLGSRPMPVNVRHIHSRRRVG